MDNSQLNSNSGDITIIPIDEITIINPRDRNEKVFLDIVKSIECVGLKKPITVTQKPYQLICGEGRIKAFKILGETHIPARIIDVTKEDALIMSLVENIARKTHRAIELLNCIGRLADLGYDKHIIAQKVGLSSSYIQGILTLLHNGEQRLLYAVEQKRIPLKVALMIAKNTNNDIQFALQDAYESGLLKGSQIAQALKIIDTRKLKGKIPEYGKPQKIRPLSAKDISKTYQEEFEKQQTALKKSAQTQKHLTFIINALNTLKKDEHFFNLLRAESLDTLPACINQ